MGAKIQGAGTSTIKIKGVTKLKGARHRIIPDRIEAGTFLIAGALTGGDLNISACDPAHLDAILSKLKEAGVKTKSTTDSVRVMGDNPFTASDLNTEEYPGFPTDMQAQFMALATQAEGTSIITENIFENRFMHAQELVRMGANIKIEGHRAVVRGKTQLSAAAVLASDLRASASSGAGRIGSRRRNHNRPRLPHRPRLRKNRRKTKSRRRPNPPHRQHAPLESPSPMWKERLGFYVGHPPRLSSRAQRGALPVWSGHCPLLLIFAFALLFAQCELSCKEQKRRPEPLQRLR